MKKKKLEEELLGYEVNSLLESKNDTNKIIHKVFTDKAVEYVKKLATYYVHEGAYEGINSDVAFVQMCLETGFLRYGGLVTADMNNFCGLGSIDSTNRGERFATPQLGVRAHIQHLHAYGTTVPLKGKLIDNRYKYVQPRGKAPDIFGLSGTWASDKQYGDKLYGLLVKLNNF